MQINSRSKTALKSWPRRPGSMGCQTNVSVLLVSKLCKDSTTLKLSSISIVSLPRFLVHWPCIRFGPRINRIGVFSCYEPRYSVIPLVGRTLFGLVGVWAFLWSLGLLLSQSEVSIPIIPYHLSQQDLLPFSIVWSHFCAFARDKATCLTSTESQLFIGLPTKATNPQCCFCSSMALTPISVPVIRRCIRLPKTTMWM